MDDEKLVLITIDAIDSETDPSESDGEMNPRPHRWRSPAGRKSTWTP